MITFSLQSGSNGNAIYVEAGDVKLLFDAGISGATAERRMAEHDRNIRDVQALIVSHDHRDHVGCVGIYQRKFDLPIYVTPQTLRVARRRCRLGALTAVRHFQPGDTLTFDGVSVHTIPTPHDAVNGVAFVVEHERRRLGILTDLGHPFEHLRDVLESVDAAYLECNYDPEMLETGNYPRSLKERIRGDGGHLSNDEAAGLIRACGRKRPAWVTVAHLSQENNHPQLAIGAQRDAIGQHYPVYHASRAACSAIWSV